MPLYVADQPAPTSSGKTAIFDLAFLRMFKRNETERPMAVYLSPTKVKLCTLRARVSGTYGKALCSERFREWSERFRKAGQDWICSYHDSTCCQRSI